MWLADTAWRLSERLSDAEIERCRDDLVAKGIAVIYLTYAVAASNSGWWSQLTGV